MRLVIRIHGDDNVGYTAICPSLPGCMSRGPTRDEARLRLDEAIRGYIAAVNNATVDVPHQDLVEA